ncbi:MAG: nucleotidyltransferase domain-containing protein [Fibromonadaceae bacterium]|jgi:predicted nucleotidyltransferase|nr:nucleotidyltransferase domain-containing protein [Fibromonadaceae bacterium]
MPLHIKATDLDTILQIFARELPDAEVLAFGSRTAETEPNPEADLDLAIMGGGVISSERMITIERSFAEAGLPFAVDVFDHAKLTNKFKGIIEKEHIAIKKMEKS